MFKKKIRKDAGEILVDDLLAHPSWEFCLDEEDVEGQTECTMRPFKPKTKKLSPKDYCCVAATFRACNGKEFTGWFSLNGANWQSPWLLEMEIFMPNVSESVAAEPRLKEFHGIVQYFPPFPARISLCLSYMSTEKALPNIELAYRIMTLDRESSFPFVVEPNQSIVGWPTSWEIPGFLRDPRIGPPNVLK